LGLELGQESPSFEKFAEGLPATQFEHQEVVPVVLEVAFEFDDVGVVQTRMDLHLAVKLGLGLRVEPLFRDHLDCEGRAPALPRLGCLVDGGK
jgi:hypothetical protein